MLAISACAALVIFIQAREIVLLYTHDAAVQAIAIHLLAFVAFYQIFDTAQVVIVNALRGYKIAFVPMLVYTAALWGIGLGGGYLLGLTEFRAADALGGATPMGAAGFWLAGVLSLIVATGILFAYFLHVSRKHQSQTRRTPGPRDFNRKEIP